VATRVSSPRLVGRQSELDLLTAAFKAAAAEDRATSYLIGGEAGVGKTRLVTELGRRVQDTGGLVAVGACLELVDLALPFGPIVQALRDVFRRLDPETRAAVVGDAEPALARLLPELGPRADGAGDGGAALFEHLVGTIVRLGDYAPTLLVLEDLHWADHSTRHFLIFLARNLRDARVLAVGTFRTDELHRRHPMRSVLAELERSGAVTRTDLSRLDRDEMSELITAIRGEPADSELVDRTFERSDGNVFFAEELLAAEEMCEQTLPNTLRDIVLTRIDALSDTAQRVLRVIAVIGRSADHRLVAAVADIPEPALTEGLREAVATQVLLTDPDGLSYHFRHALAYEAVYEDLLPSERVQLHTRVAEHLERRPDWFDGDAAQLASELACHWNSAHHQRRGLPASIAAAREAAQMYAYAEAQAHLERALAMWSHVPDAQELTGMTHAAVLRDAAEAAQMSGRFDRAVAFIREALDELDPETHPVDAGIAHERLGRYLWQANRPADEYLSENHEAVRLVPSAPPSVERARVLATLGQQLMLAGRNAEAIDVCNEAIAVAQEVGARVEEGHARNSLGAALGGVGRFADGRAELQLARDIANATHSWADVARAAVNYGANLQSSGEHVAAVELSLAGADVARRHGLERACGVFLRLNAAESLYELGRWDEMEEQMREANAVDVEGVDQMRTSRLWAQLYAARGDYEAAAEQLASAHDLHPRTDDKVNELEHLAIAARIRAWSGDAGGAIAIARREVAYHDTPGTCSDLGPTLLAVASSVTDDDATLVEFAATLERWIADCRWGGGAPGDYERVRAQIDAERHRDDAVAWRKVGDSWAAGNRLPRVAYARYREAGAHVTRNELTAAEGCAQEAYEIATRVGFAWLVAQIEQLARAHGLDLGESLRPDSPADAAGLTAREREVLSLLAAGRTNRQIGEQLFISTKTASVHVSNILAKLQVANRGEAAAAARRLGLDGASTSTTAG
jgi:ATP/maltotriose-dependent transcriptional regulator MalT